MRQCSASPPTDTFVAYQPILENAILPQTADLYRAMKELAEY